MEPSLFITQPHSSKARPAGQCSHRRLGVRLASYLLLLGLLCLGETGCTSIYRRARTRLPADPAAELSLRVAEAGQAERLAKQAGQKLLDSLQRQKPRGITDIGFDRLEAAAFELDRRVLAARDAAETCSQPIELVAEIERLSRQARGWLEYVQTNRAADPVAQLRQIEGLLK